MLSPLICRPAAPIPTRSSNPFMAAVPASTGAVTATPRFDELIERQSREADPDRRKGALWEIERKLATDDARPIIFYRNGGTCRQPYVKGLTLMANSPFNAWRMEDVWLDH